MSGLQIGKRRFIADQPFWIIGLAMIGSWKFVKWPLGWLGALIIGGYWLIKNKNFIEWWISQMNCRLTFWLGGIQEYSLWYDQEGRKEILALINRLSAEGKSYCNLVDEMELPCYSHWYAICKGLDKDGIVSQITTTNFYILWQLPIKVK